MDYYAAMRCSLSLLFLLAWAPAWGAASLQTEHVSLSLESEQRTVTEGDTLWLGARFKILPHWHLYWKNPGDSGAPTLIRWHLPPGWRAGEIRWPVPRRIPFGPLVNYGYEDELTLLVPIEAGPLQGEEPVLLRAELEWLVCKEDCIPEEGELSLSLPPGTGTAEYDPAVKAHFAEVRNRLPKALGTPARYRLHGKRLLLEIPLQDSEFVNMREPWFAGEEGGQIAASGPQHWERVGSALRFSLPQGELPPAPGTSLQGLLVPRAGYAYAVTAEPAAAGESGVSLPGTAVSRWLGAILLAFLGGIILNLMPCVLPVLAIKLMRFSKQAEASRRHLAADGLLYGMGVLCSFALLAALLLALRAGGEAAGWGFQLQSPVVVGLLTALMLLVGLNLSGVFLFGSRLMRLGAGGTGQSSLTPGAFLEGILAVLVASPCTAPFMGAALGFAMTRPAPEAMGVFLALGAGFALPMVLLSLLPGWLRRLPPPGPWMEDFKQLLAFPMYGAAAWLLWVLSRQTTGGQFASALAALVLMALAAWLWGRAQRGSSRAGLSAALAALLAAALVFPTGEGEAVAERGTWSPERVAALRGAGRPVLVNFTADWCITCKVNERLVLSRSSLQAALRERDIVLLTADWTSQDSRITEELAAWGRSGVPLYLLYPPGAGAPAILPQVLTQNAILKAADAPMNYTGIEL